LAAALGGRVERMTNLENRPLWLTKEDIHLSEKYFSLPYVKKILEGVPEKHLDQLKPLVLHSVHGDHVT